ncbi:hypothetical protein MSAN_01962200 [Mycena sanguinolenta]|uniref:Uncharacterized protein n=1 Tax=Mycena sanguinolenta TaxID=230812 RepID=A0A8H7CPT7_9AGAR|nr:hypothetical protein MSAN_01962200 [Mycena sanguinolenta]
MNSPPRVCGRGGDGRQLTAVTDGLEEVRSAFVGSVAIASVVVGVEAEASGVAAFPFCPFLRSSPSNPSVSAMPHVQRRRLTQFDDSKTFSLRPRREAVWDSKGRVCCTRDDEHQREAIDARRDDGITVVPTKHPRRAVWRLRLAFSDTGSRFIGDLKVCSRSSVHPKRAALSACTCAFPPPVLPSISYASIALDAAGNTTPSPAFSNTSPSVRHASLASRLCSPSPRSPLLAIGGIAERDRL